MKHLLIFLSITVFALISCEEEYTSLIGEDYVSINTKVYFIDSLTVRASTFQFDSLIVSNTSRFLIGSYNDPVFGKTKSKVYTKLDNSIYDIDNEAIYDSIALILKYDTYSYNDTIPMQRFNVYEVLEDIEPNDGSYYNTTHFSYDTSPIGIKDVRPRPNKNDSINIKINNAFGETLFNKIKENDINNIDEFLNDYKGLLIDADDTNTTILGFEKSSLLRLYYKIDDETYPINQTIDFSFNSFNTFSHTVSNQTGTYFETILNQETILESTTTDNYCFIQSGIGIVTRIDIPFLNSLNDITGDGIVTQARLKFSLKEDVFSENLLTKDELQVFIIDEKGNVLSSLLYADGETPVTGIITNDNPEFESDVYTIDLMPFINLKQTETHEEYFLAIYPQDFNNSIDRYVFHDSNASDNLQMKLELTYAVYNE